MNRIKKVVFKNFKFFYGERELNLERENALIYGENGSGKSSIYWGLYTFLQSVYKPKPEDVQKYFKPRHDHNLVNRFADEITTLAQGEELSFIKIVFEDEHMSENTQVISGGPVGAKNAQIVKQAAAGSEFINYRLLSRIHDFKNSEQINLFPIFESDVLRFINFSELLIRQGGEPTSNAHEWWQYIKAGMVNRGKMHEQPYKDFQKAIDDFNKNLKFYLDSITESVNDYLLKFKLSCTIKFETIKSVYDPFEKNSTTKRIHKTFPPKIILEAFSINEKLSEEKKRIIRVHTFFNEAKLTAVALSIRLAMLDFNLGTSSLSDDTPKLLVLDDLLLSLDMSNRDIVLDIILGESLKKYQILIFTHDKNFFELIRHKIKRNKHSKWKFIEMYDSIKNGIPQPLIFESDSYIGNAEHYLKEKKYEIAGNYLRKEAEHFCKKFLPDRYKFGQYGQLKPLAMLLQEAILFSKQNGIEHNLLEDLDSYRKFLLNDSSHDSFDVPKYKAEIENCIRTLLELNQIKYQCILEKDYKLEFVLQTSSETAEDKAGTYKFEIIIQDDFRLLKEVGKESVLSKGMVNFKIYKDGNLLPSRNTHEQYNHEIISLKKMYDDNYNSSDKSKSENFWDEIIISETGSPLSTLRLF